MRPHEYDIYSKTIEAYLDQGTPWAEIAATLDLEADKLRCWGNRRGLRSCSKAVRQPNTLPCAQGTCIVDHEAGTATLLSKATPADRSPEERDDVVVDLIERNGLDPAEWVVVNVTLNEWDGPVKGGGTQLLRQVKVTLRLAASVLLPGVIEYNGPANLATNIDGYAPRHSVHEPQRIIIEGDHHAPYQDEELDVLLTQLHYELKPDGQVFLGDTADFPTISRHKDHPAAMATVNECLKGAHGILLRRREACPSAWAEKLQGNHDWRIDAEILARAERIYGAGVAGDPSDPLWSLEKALDLDELGITLITDPLGWEHAEVELADDLVVRHGWLHGAKTAEKSVKKRGKSIIVGHSHNRDSAYVWDAFGRKERQGHVLGVACRTDAHYAPANGWGQGAGIVTLWPDGRWIFEHVHYEDRSLVWRDRRWEV